MGKKNRGNLRADHEPRVIRLTECRGIAFAATAGKREAKKIWPRHRARTRSKLNT